MICTTHQELLNFEVIRNFVGLFSNKYLLINHLICQPCFFYVTRFKIDQYWPDVSKMVVFHHLHQTVEWINTEGSSFIISMVSAASLAGQVLPWSIFKTLASFLWTLLIEVKKSLKIESYPNEPKHDVVLPVFKNGDIDRLPTLISLPIF